jgi:hypothetical protein
VQLRVATFLIALAALLTTQGRPQDPPNPNKPGDAKSEPAYEETFSGTIVELSATKITVSRSILGKPAEKRTFLVKSDTRIEGKLRMHAKVTVGFDSPDDGDVARLVVVRTSQAPKQPDKK